MMEALQAKQRFLTAGAKAVNPFAKFPGPDGNYYAQLIRIVWSRDPKSQCPIVRAAFMVIASVEDNSTTHGAIPVRIQFYLRESAKSSEQDAWDRLYVGLYQALSCVTASWGSRLDAAGQPISLLITLQEETDRLIAEKPCVVLSITQNPTDVRYQNINIREHLTPEALSHFTKPSMEIDYDQLNEDDSEQEIPDETELPDFAEAVSQAKAMLAPLDVAGIIEQAKASQLDLDYDHLATVSAGICRATVLVAYIEKNGYVASDYDLTVSDDEGSTQSLVEEGSVSTAVTTDVAEVFEELEEEEESLDEEVVEDEDRATQVQNYVAALSRLDTQKKIRTFQPEFKFFKTQSDNDLRDILADIMIADPTAPF